MQSSIYETALLALASWRAAKSENVDEMLAIACVIRNQVLRSGLTYSEVISTMPLNQGYPPPNHPALIMPGTGLLAQIEDVYTNKMPDLTSNLQFKEGASYFGRVTDEQGTGSWFEVNILQQQQFHPLIGQFGTQQFFK